MRLVTTMMTTKEMPDHDVQKAVQIISRKYNYKVTSSKHNFGDRRYFETDLDILGVEFTKETLYDGINRLISAYEEIMNTIPMQIDFISANDDTETEIARYEKDINDVKDFGLFVTKRTIPNLKPYYSSKNCNAYVNLAYVSFGVYY
ncbi:hypothetical protein SDC9_105388 [bioreactor metagenome]|uniref:Uncharacterized protein n=1 Tax=bioreactor metagenome TaxID=1076179 RepID=A0A645AZG3_9ZZZZ